MSATTSPTAPTVTIRRASTVDGDAVARMHRRCSLESVFRRYLTAMPALSPHLQRRLLELHLTLVAELGGEVVGIAHLAGSTDGSPPELAVLVEDAWQRHGIGSRLVEAVVAAAESEGHDEVVARTLPSSAAVHTLARRIRDGRLTPSFTRGDDGLVLVTLHLRERARTPISA